MLRSPGRRGRKLRPVCGCVRQCFNCEFPHNHLPCCFRHPPHEPRVLNRKALRETHQFEHAVSEESDTRRVIRLHRYGATGAETENGAAGCEIPSHSSSKVLASRRRLFHGQHRQPLSQCEVRPLVKRLSSRPNRNTLGKGGHFA